MARKPSDIVSPNLRIREELRRRLAKAAEKNGVSLNQEMTKRLEDSFVLKSQEELLSRMEVTWTRIEQAKLYPPNVQISAADMDKEGEDQ